jgi:hypothetical protein
VRGLAFSVFFFFILLLLPYASAQVVEGEASVRTPTPSEHFSFRKFVIFLLDFFYLKDILDLITDSFETLMRGDLSAAFLYMAMVEENVNKCFNLSLFFVISSICSYLSTYYSFIRRIADIILPLLAMLPFCHSPLTEAPFAFFEWCTSVIDRFIPLFRI